MTTVSIRLRLAVQPWFKDHCFDGRIILPAVEAMATLAGVVRQHRPGVELWTMTAGRFVRLLEIAPGQERIEAEVELEEGEKGLTARLLTRRRTTAMARLLAHCELCFGAANNGRDPGTMPPPLTGPFWQVDARRIYAELVPFGSAYRSLQGMVRLGREGAEGTLLAPTLVGEDADGGPLGSPFPLDGAMHAACVHGQGLVDFIPFPVGFDRRRILAPTRPGGSYWLSARLCRRKPDQLVYDVLLTGTGGRVYERIEGLVMRDVSGGRIKPPAWIRRQGG